MNITEDDYLAHYGILRRSGRFPWGSGEGSTTVEGRSKNFMGYIKEMRDAGLTESQIAKGVGMKVSDLRATKSIAGNQIKQANIRNAQALRDKGLSNVEVGKKMGLNESSVRALLAPGVKDKADTLTAVADMLRAQVDEKTYIDVGSGVENHIGISADKLKTAVAMLESEGYQRHTVNIPTIIGNETKVIVLTPPGTTQRDVFLNRDKIRLTTDFSEDQGRSFLGLHPPIQINPDRIDVVYKKDGGDLADGVIYVRPGVDDLSLGKSSYAQVRIAVGDGHYLKGMAIYKDDLPKGVDLQFNTNKESTGNKLDALKKVSDDKENPFGSQIKKGGQLLEVDANGKSHVVSAMNIINEEGDWNKWSDTLSSQILSKQRPSLAKEQLAKTYNDKIKKLDEIMALTNPVVKERLLRDLASSTDSSAAHLKAAAMTGQKTHVILPIKTMPESQVYAQNYENGSRVALVRFPHAGRFEIPELIVNNNQPEAKKLLANAKDAIGIHPKVAERMSGADFDGDFVLVIPNNSGKIQSDPALAGLKDFDPRGKYKKYDGMPIMTAKQKGKEMGDISNLLTDMTIHKASPDELARAVRHSMVVIDAEKHELDYKASAIDHGIPALKKKYQGRTNAGASTLISRAGRKERIPDRKARPAQDGGPINKVTGELEFVPTGKTYTNSKGEKVPSTKKVDILSVVKDANTLSSGTNIEQVYADHSNNLKALANRIRLEAINTPPLKYSPSAKKVYKQEVDELNAQVDLAYRNRPLERNAQVLADSFYKAIKNSNPNMDEAKRNKIKFQALEEARNRTGASRKKIVLTEKQWEAIQAGAISPSKLRDVLSIADMDRVKALATPRTSLLMTPTNTARAKAMLNSGASRAEVARALGVSLTTLDTGIA